MNDSPPILDVRHLHVEFKTDRRTVRAVQDVSFQVPRGQTVGIVGESGSGKSVTSLAIMGLVPSPPGYITRGEIWFRAGTGPTPIDPADAVDLLSLSSPQMRAYRGGQISMIFQEPMSSLNPVYTCGFQLIEAIQLHQPDLSAAAARRQAIALLQEVQLLPPDSVLEAQHRQQRGLSPTAELDEVTAKFIQQAIHQYQQSWLDRYPHELSGGQIQRVMIAMAISCNPSLLIADEPTTALDVTVQARILDLLRELRDRRQMSMMFITHDLGVIAEIADIVVVMYQGCVVEVGPVLEIFTRPQHPYTQGLLACRPQPDRQLRYLPTVADFLEAVPNADSSAPSQLRTRAVAPDQTQRYLEVISPAERQAHLQELTTRSPLLQVENLSVTYPVRGLFGEVRQHIAAVDQVSFQVYTGETLGLVGESGCGKTTLSRSLLKLVPVTSGRIWFEGQDITSLKGRALRRLRRHLQIIFQDPFSALDPRMTIGAAVMEPLNIHGAGANSRDRQERVTYLLNRVGLDPTAINRYPHEFSGGQRQRICIARALALNPKFIICDESVSALDVSVQAQVLNLLKELQGEFGLTYIFISHDLSVVEFMSDRIMVMNRGRIEEIGPATEIYRQPQRDYTRKLIASIPTGSLDRIRAQQAGRSSAQ